VDSQVEYFAEMCVEDRVVAANKQAMLLLGLGDLSNSYHHLALAQLTLERQNAFYQISTSLANKQFESQKQKILKESTSEEITWVKRVLELT